MPKKVVMLWLTLFLALQLSAQTDTLNTIVNTDTAALENTRAVAVSEAAKGKIWPVIALIGVILVSSYAIYNVRSR